MSSPRNDESSSFYSPMDFSSVPSIHPEKGRRGSAGSFFRGRPEESREPARAADAVKGADREVQRGVLALPAAALGPGQRRGGAVRACLRGVQEDPGDHRVLHAQQRQAAGAAGLQPEPARQRGAVHQEEARAAAGRQDRSRGLPLPRLQDGQRLPRRHPAAREAAQGPRGQGPAGKPAEQSPRSRRPQRRARQQRRNAHFPDPQRRPVHSAAHAQLSARELGLQGRAERAGQPLRAARPQEREPRAPAGQRDPQAADRSAQGRTRRQERYPRLTQRRSAST